MRMVSRLDYLLFEIEQSQRKQEITLELLIMLDEIVETFSKRANWRGFQNMEVMKEHALSSLISSVCRFDSSKSSNAYAFCIAICHYAFRKTLSRNDPFTLCEASS